MFAARITAAAAIKIACVGGFVVLVSEGAPGWACVLAGLFVITRLPRPPK